MTYLITKASGTIEEFSLTKFVRSLRRAGAHADLITSIKNEVLRIKPATTQELHQLAAKLLEQARRPVASRYNLKRALMELGPAGYPFEDYIAELFKSQGYQTQVGQIVPGKCVDHEVDIIAQKGKVHHMIECKFHNGPGLKSDVKVALYVHSRFLDLVSAWKLDPVNRLQFDTAWLVTNTKFTTQAEQYATCEQITLLSWDKGPRESLARMIDRTGLHPVTTLTGLSNHQKRELVRHGFVLCKDIGKRKDLLRTFGLTDLEIDQLVSEAHEVCTLAVAED